MAIQLPQVRTRLTGQEADHGASYGITLLPYNAVSTRRMRSAMLWLA